MTCDSQDRVKMEQAQSWVPLAQWHHRMAHPIPSHLPHVIPPLLWQFTPAAVQVCRLGRRTEDRAEEKEGHIPAEVSWGILNKCMGNFNLPNLITLVLRNKSFQWGSGLNPLCWEWQAMHWFAVPSNPPSYILWGEDKILCVKKHTQELHCKGDIRTANLMT